MRASCSIALAAVILTSCSADGPPSPTTPATNATAAAITITSGDNQQGKVGEPLGSPFVVRVTDPAGLGVPHASVNFTVSAGGGTVAAAEDFLPGVTVSTDGKGLAQVRFKPRVLGSSAVTASIAGGGVPSVTFSIDATALVIERWGPLWDIGFVAGSCFCSDVIVPIGTPVEWKTHSPSATPDMSFTVTSVSTPAGGSPFDSGVLKPHERFQFIPTTAGTWEYRDRLTGHTGTLTAR